MKKGEYEVVISNLTMEEATTLLVKYKGKGLIRKQNKINLLL